MTIDELNDHANQLTRDVGDVQAKLSQMLKFDSSQGNYDYNMPMSDDEDEVMHLDSAISKKLCESTREYLDDVKDRPFDVLETMAYKKLTSVDDADGGLDELADDEGRNAGECMLSMPVYHAH